MAPIRRSLCFDWPLFCTSTLTCIGLLFAAAFGPDLASGSAALKISVGSFNVQTFGTSFVANSSLVSTLVQVIQRYDVMFMMEIRDASNTAIGVVMNALNQGPVQYQATLSPRLGRTSSKEQYAYIYKPSVLTLVKNYTFIDSSDYFERPPFIGLFRLKEESSLTLDNPSVTFLGLHSKPTDTVNEMNHLVDVYDTLTPEFNRSVLLMGDLNAGCSYASATQLYV